MLIGAIRIETVLVVLVVLNLVGLNIDWIVGPAANCFHNGNHLGIQPHAFKDMIDFFAEENEEITGIYTPVHYNRKGAEILFVAPSGDYFADPGIYTCMGYMALFHEIGLDYTFSTYASEGGNFGLFTSADMMKRLNAKMYAEAKRLGLANTRFTNATGLSDPQHYATAADLAKLASALIRDYPEFYPLYSQKEFRYNNITQPNRNRLLWTDPYVGKVLDQNKLQCCGTHTGLNEMRGERFAKTIEFNKIIGNKNLIAPSGMRTGSQETCIEFAKQLSEIAAKAKEQ